MDWIRRVFGYVHVIVAALVAVQFLGVRFVRMMWWLATGRR